MHWLDNPFIAAARFAHNASARSMAAIQEHLMHHRGDAEAAARVPISDAGRAGPIHAVA